MEPDVEMGVVTILPGAPEGTSKPVEEYLELAASGAFAAFQDEMGKHPLGITAGVDVYEDRSALHMAALHGRIEIVRLILSAPEVSSQIVNARDRFGYTPLHLAVREEHEDVVRILAKSAQTRILAACGSTSQQDEEGQDCDGFTPLHLAAMSGNIAIAKLILQEFACQELPVNIHATTWQGATALDIAKRRRHVELVDILESWDVEWLQLERQKSANSVNAILVGAALVATVTFGCLLQPPWGISNLETSSKSSLAAAAAAPAPSGNDDKLRLSDAKFQVGWFLMCTALSFSFSIVSLVIGTRAVIPSTGASLKREVQQLRSSVSRASNWLFESIFFLSWASQLAGTVVAANAAVGGLVTTAMVIVLLFLPIIVLAFVSRQMMLPEKVKVSKWVAGWDIGVYVVATFFIQKDTLRKALF